MTCPKIGEDVSSTEKNAGFILRCLNLFVQNGTSVEELRAEISSLDWDFIIKISDLHRVLPFFTVALRNTKEWCEIQGSVKKRLVAGMMRAEWENVTKQLEFQAINRAFEAKGILVIPLKGIALTFLIYQKYPYRQMGDIDLLVQEKDLKNVRALLRERNFSLKALPYRWQTQTVNTIFGRGSYVKEGLDLDLQWNPRFLIARRLIEWGAQGVWKRALSFPPGGKNVFLLSPEDNLRYLLLQICSDFEGRDEHGVFLHLVQLLDAALVIKNYSFDSGSSLEAISASFESPVRERVVTCLGAIRECLLEDKGYKDISPRSRGFVEFFLSRPVNFESRFSGKSFLSLPVSPVDKAVFLAGYLLPRKTGTASTYLNHWKKLLRKVGALGTSYLTTVRKYVGLASGKGGANHVGQEDE